MRGVGARRLQLCRLNRLPPGAADPGAVWRVQRVARSPMVKLQRTAWLFSAATEACTRTAQLLVWNGTSHLLFLCPSPGCRVCHVLELPGLSSVLMLLLWVVFQMWCTTGQQDPAADFSGHFFPFYPPFVGPEQSQCCKFQFALCQVTRMAIFSNSLVIYQIL